MNDDIKFYNEEEIRQLDIMHVRDAARSVGVQSIYSKKARSCLLRRGEADPSAPRVRGSRWKSRLRSSTSRN